MPTIPSLNLLPGVRSLVIREGKLVLPARLRLLTGSGADKEVGLFPIANRLEAGLKEVGIQLDFQIPARDEQAQRIPVIQFKRERLKTIPRPDEGYRMVIDPQGIHVHYEQTGGLRAAVATMRQLLREYGREQPCLEIRDWPDFPRRGVMLDISRGRVPKLQTLLELVDHLADFKINEFQLYIEHTFAYRAFKSVWQSWGALTGAEIRELDSRCRELGIDLVPNQNSFGHLRYFLQHPSLRPLAEVADPYEADTGDFVRRPSTLAPNHPATLPFLCKLYDELLPNFTSRSFNVGCDETWDLGRGQSRQLCQRLGKGRVYLDFLLQIHSEVGTRGRRMMFWGDIILHYPKLIKHLPRDVIALNWGYEANHPFEREARAFARSGIPFYVCPGTSTWMTLIGRHDNALANLRNAACSGSKHGAIGYLITDWGDGGHPQPLAVSYLPFLAGAALGWCRDSFDEKLLSPVLSRDVFHDETRQLAQAAFQLGFAHLKFQYSEPNVTPFGAVIAAPEPVSRELFCRNGLKYYSRIKTANVELALSEVECLRKAVHLAKPRDELGRHLAAELDLAARMAEQSCKIMLWQQSLESGKSAEAIARAKTGIKDLIQIEKEFNALWSVRYKATTEHSIAFLDWRRHEYSKLINEQKAKARQ